MPNTHLDDRVVAAPRSLVARHPVAVLLTVGIAFVWVTQLGSLLAGADVMPAKIAELVVLLGGATWISYRVGGRQRDPAAVCRAHPMATGLALPDAGAGDAAAHALGGARYPYLARSNSRLGVSDSHVPVVPGPRRGHRQPVGGDGLGRIRSGPADGRPRASRRLAPTAVPFFLWWCCSAVQPGSVIESGDAARSGGCMGGSLDGAWAGAIRR